MMLKRGVWIAACLVGVIVCGGLAVLIGYASFFAADAGVELSSRAVIGPLGLLLVAGVCAAGIFMSPREMHEASKTDVDEEPAEWIKELRRENDTNAER